MLIHIFSRFAAFNDMVILPIAENMNNGKTHAYFSWAASHAWVPPPTTSLPFSYTNETREAPPLAAHDPRPEPGAPADWVRPDYVLKADDDSFIMLAELEGRLRVEMHAVISDSKNSYHSRTTSAIEDPLVYWGYLVKNKFMGGEMYALSWSVVQWIAQSEATKALTRGAEDKLVARWVLMHPRAGDVRWKNEHCWIYDHPKAGTVYSHGFLFPSEASRVRRQLTQDPLKKPSPPTDQDGFSHSSVSQFGTRYTPPSPNLTPLQSVEALVEGSAMSMVAISSRLEDPSLEPSVALQRSVDRAWREREGRKERYEHKKLGGTVLVHFIKKNEWWEETALALLGGDDVIKSDSPYPSGRMGGGSRVGNGNGLDNSGRSSSELEGEIDTNTDFGTGTGTSTHSELEIETGTDGEIEIETEIETGTGTGTGVGVEVEIETESGEEEDALTTFT